MAKFEVLQDRNYRLFVTGYGLSYTLYWVTLLAVGWWMWEVTGSAIWVGFVFFCDLFPAVLITPWASAIADRGDRFRLLKTVLWIQVFTGFALAFVAWIGALTPPLLALFVFVEGALIGFSQPAFFGMINRLVSPQNLSAAVGLNVSVIHMTFILGPLLAALVFSFGLGIAPLAFAANAIGTLVYLYSLSRITLRPQPDKEAEDHVGIWAQVLGGLSVFWTNPVVFRAMVLILGVAVLHRPLVSLMPGINDRFDLLDAARFTFLTASFMTGSVLAGLILASRNSDNRTSDGAPMMLGLFVALFAALFILLHVGLIGAILTMALLIGLGFSSTYVLTSNTITLQHRTPEHLRSRVLGNNFMMNRALGAISVITAGALIEVTDFAFGMILIAACVTIVVPLALLYRR